METTKYDYLKKRLFIYFSGYNPFPCKKWEWDCILEEGAADLAILTDMDEEEALSLLKTADDAGVEWEERSHGELKEILKAMKARDINKISSVFRWHRREFYKLIYNMGL